MFTSIEYIALIVIVASLIKMLVLWIKPKSWMNFAKGIYSKPGLTQFIAFILAGVVLWYLLEAGITIIQILAVTAFVALLVVVGLAKEVDTIIKKYETKIKKGKLWKEYWFYILLWIILIIWGLKEIFM